MPSPPSSEKKEKVLNEFSPEELAKFAKEHLNEDPARVKSDIKAIQEWIKKQPHLHKYARTDDAHILAFLRGCKFSLERTKEKMDTFYSVRSAVPEWYSGWDPTSPVMQDMISAGVSVPLKGYDKHGRKVVLMRPGRTDPKKHTILDNFKFSFMVSELMIEQMGQGSITGFVGVQDTEGMSMGHLAQFSPAMGKKAMTIWQDCYPQHPKGMHFLNMPSSLESIFNLMKSFAKDKMKQRMIVHAKGDLTALHEAVGKEVLPEEYGGKNGKLQDHIDAQRENMEKHAKFFAQQCKLRSNEKKRQGKPKGHSELFGMEGSFRQLAFD